MIKKLITIGAIFLTLMGSGACGPRNEPTGEWNGTDFRNCAIPRTPPPGAQYGIRKGFVHILLIVVADRYDNKGRCIPNISLPIRIRINGKLDGQQAFKLDRGRNLPWTANVETIWIEHIFIGPLKPSSAGKFWEASVHAVHEESGTLPVAYERAYVRCAIFVDGIRADANSDRIREHIAAASCRGSGILRGA